MNPSDQINQPTVPGRLSCDSYVSSDIRDYGNRVRKSAECYAKFRQSWSGPLVAAADDDEEEGVEFGFSTPAVWGPTSASSSPHHYRNLSPASKAKAIVRGQMEVMEMVSKMPESCYELSLKDLVEPQQPIIEEKEKQEQESEKVVKKKMEMVKKKNGSVRRNNDDGFLLKMVFPVAFGTKKKKIKSELGSYSLKVAPRPPVVERSDNKEWWKKRIGQSESTNSSSSSNNGSGESSVSSSSLTRNSSRHETGGCLSFSFIRNKKSKNVQ